MQDINLVTPERQARLDALTKECQDLHLPVPVKTFITATLFKNNDPESDPIMRVHAMAQTWNLNYYKLVGWMFLSPGPNLMADNVTNLRDYPQNFTLTVTNQGGGVDLVGTNPNGPHNILNSFEYGGSDVLDGIVIGESAAADTIQTYTLPGQLTQTGIIGTAVENNKTTWDRASKTWTQQVRKFFHNAVVPPRDFTITEVGLVKSLGIYTANARNAVPVTPAQQHRILLDRTRLAVPVPLAYNTMLRVDYNIVFTLPDVPMVDGQV